MKPAIKTILSLTLNLLLLSSLTFASPVNPNEEIKPNNKKTEQSFNRIHIEGNVEVTLIQRSNPAIHYAEENTGSVKVTHQNGLLNIRSIGNGIAKLIIYANGDLYRIQATDHVNVKTEGQFKTRWLQIFLKGNAIAHIDSRTEGLYTVIEENSDLKLSGQTAIHTLKMCKNPKLTIEKFAALKTNITSTEQEEEATGK